MMDKFQKKIVKL